MKSPSQALRTARPHPFAASSDTLGEVHPGKHATATLLLPALRTAPLDSPELVRITPRPAPTTAAMLLPWSVPVVWFDPAATLAVLGGRADAVRYGASVDFLAEVAAFARELAVRGRVLPVLDRIPQGPVARWRAVLQGPDVVAMHALVTAMPPAGRAEADSPGDAGGQRPSELVSDAVRALVDAAMRERLADGQAGSLLDLLPPRRGRRPKRPGAAEAWLAALSNTDGRFGAELDDLDELERVLSIWQDFGVGQSGPARATFRLSEATATEDAHWRLEFLLQSVDDPSLLVPAEQTWNAGETLRRWLDRPQQLLLTELGRASRVYPELEPALRQACPVALELDADGAYHFLSEAAGSLDEAGFGVLLPSWWDRRRTLGLTLSAYTPVDGVVTKQSRFGRDQLMQFRWDLAVGDDTLTEDEIAGLAETKAPLVRLRGQWVAVDPEQLRRGLEFLEHAPTGHKTAAEVLALAASHPDDVDTPLEVTGVYADGWLGDLLDGTAAQSLRPLDPPDGLVAELRPYQQRGLPWLAFLSALQLGGCLADDMGLGKTVQLLALEAYHREQEPGAGPTLLLCPMSVVGNWQREAAKFTPDLRVYAHHGRERLRGDALGEHLADTDLVLTTYATATRDIDDLAERAWQRVVLDEAQAVKTACRRRPRPCGAWRPSTRSR